MNHRGDVVAAALVVLEAEGLDGLTMRKVGARIGVQPGALYRHFPHKRALLEALADKLIEGVGAQLPDGDWRQQLTAIAQRSRTALLSHRDAARVVAGTFVVEPNSVAVARAAVDALVAAGLSPTRASWAVLVLLHYVLGHTIEEQAQAELVAEGEWDTKREEAKGRVDAQHAEAFDAGFTSTPQERFDYGVATFLAGIERDLADT